MADRENIGRGLCLGAHVSIAGGLPLAASRASDLGCRAFQVFTANSNRWHGRPIEEAEALEFRRLVRQGGFCSVIAHDSYLVNLASPDETLRERSIRALADEIDRDERLGLDCMVMHPGAHRGAGVEEGLDLVVEALSRVLRASRGAGVRILLETTAGQGTSLGSTFEELRWLIDGVGAGDRIGVCLDTCHIFAAGYDVRDRSAYRETMERFDEVVGLGYLKLVHLNDSRKGLGSRVDRHTHIGKGEIGREGFRQFVADPRLRDLPMIIETPKDGGKGMDRRNLALLRRLADR
jgi:deoxyribonuclease-4